MKAISFSRLENIFTAFSLCFFAGNPINLLLFGRSGEEGFGGDQSNFLEPGINLCICLISAMLLLLRWKSTACYFWSRDKIIWAVVLLTFISTLWSAYPEITFRRAIRLLMLTLFSFYFSTRYSFKQQVQFISVAFIAAISMSIAFAVLPPRYGIMSGIHAGAWRGLYMHKNALGAQMSLSFGFFMLSALGRGQHRRYGLVGVALAVTLAILSRSSMALALVIILLLSVPFYMTLRFRYNSLIVLSSFALLSLGGIVVVAWTQAGNILELLGRDLTLTGRSDLWPAVWYMIQQRLWLGYGYEAFWRGEYSESSLIWRIVGWMPPHAHNGLLELLLIFGVIGTTLFLVGTLRVFLKSLLFIHREKTFDSAWPSIFLTYFILSNTSEFNIFSGSIIWILYSSICFTLVGCKNVRVQATSRSLLANGKEEFETVGVNVTT